MVDMIKNTVCIYGIVKESFFVKLKKTLDRHDSMVTRSDLILTTSLGRTHI